MSLHLSPLTKNLVDQLGALHVASEGAGVEEVKEVGVGELAELFLFGGHGSGLLSVLDPEDRLGGLGRAGRNEAQKLALVGPVQGLQRLADLVPWLGTGGARQVADHWLLAPAESRELLLRNAALFEVGDE